MAAIFHGATCFTERRRKHIIDDIKGTVPEGFNRLRDINLAVDHLLKLGRLKEDKLRGAKTGPEKTILRVIGTKG